MMYKMEHLGEGVYQVTSVVPVTHGMDAINYVCRGCHKYCMYVLTTLRGDDDSTD